MKEICFAEYAKCLQKAIQEPNGNEEVVRLLLDWIIEKYNISNKKDGQFDLEKSTISGIMNHKVEIPRAIRSVCTTKEIGEEARLYCGKKIIPYLNEFLKDDMYEEMIRAIEQEANISKAMRKKLVEAYESEKYDLFLGQLLIYSINQKNKIDDVQLEIDNIPLLEEANFICPHCQAQLIQYVKNKIIEKYKIIKIYPDDIKNAELEEAVKLGQIIKPKYQDQIINKIALCKDCSEKYEEMPTLSEYLELCALKDQLVKSHSARASVDKLEIEDDIRNVISGLSNITQETELKELSFSALKLNQKILPENFLLEKLESDRVIHFYHYINDLFSEMDRSTGSFRVIASEISAAFEKLNRAQLSQSEIVDQLALWIKKKSKVKDSQLEACHIVVAYFIQNCEVFHEISK